MMATHSKALTDLSVIESEEEDDQVTTNNKESDLSLQKPLTPIEEGSKEISESFKGSMKGGKDLRKQHFDAFG